MTGSNLYPHFSLAAVWWYDRSMCCRSVRERRLRMDVVDITLMDSWAEEEFAAADLGDARRTKRLIALADTFARRPSASLPNAAQDPAMLKAAYRFFDTDAIEPDAILASHCTATQERCAS